MGEDEKNIFIFDSELIHWHVNLTSIVDSYFAAMDEQIRQLKERNKDHLEKVDLTMKEELIAVEKIVHNQA